MMYVAENEVACYSGINENVCSYEWWDVKHCNFLKLV